MLQNAKLLFFCDDITLMMISKVYTDYISLW